VSSLSSKSKDARLSTIDRKILKILLAPNGGVNEHASASPASDGIMAADLRVSLAEVTKRRALLEKDFLNLSYHMNIASLGYRRVEFLIATQRGLSLPVANELMMIKAIVRIGHSIGEPTIDLRAELIIRDNGELLDLLEQIKAISGVRNVVWTEIVKIAGDKGSVPADIIDIL
jgi:DNA-binding Lrp family transcriptional regulator